MRHFHASERDLIRAARLLRAVLHSTHPVVIQLRDQAVGGSTGVASTCRLVEQLETTFLPTPVDPGAPVLQ